MYDTRERRHTCMLSVAQASNQKGRKTFTPPRLFSITEVLECILKHLDLPDLLRAQQVSKWWNEGIQGSALLRKRLFQRPMEEEHVENVFVTKIIPVFAWESTCEKVKDSVYKDLVKKFVEKSRRAGYPDYQQDLVTRVEQPFQHMGSRIHRLHTLHPFLRQHPQTNIQSHLTMEKALDSHNRNASWRSMFLSQPPLVESVQIVCGTLQRTLSDNAEGHTFGDIADALVRGNLTDEDKSKSALGKCTFDLYLTRTEKDSEKWFKGVNFEVEMRQSEDMSAAYDKCIRATGWSESCSTEQSKRGTIREMGGH